MTELYAYREQGRRPIVWLAAAACVGMICVGLYHEESWLLMTPVYAAGAMLLYMLVKNPVSGVQLFEDRLIMSPWSAPQTVMLDQLAKIEFVEWSDSTDMNLHLKSGDVVKVAQSNIPPRTAILPTLESLNISVETR